MRKIYSLLALLIMATLSFAATAATAKVYIDNKAGVILYTNGDNWDRVENQLVNGQYVDITFTPGLTWNLDSSSNLTFFQIVRNGEVIASNIKPVFDIGFDFAVNDGDIIEIFVNAPSSGKATASVYVDDITYSLFIYDSGKKDWIDITSQLTVGETASIQFDPATQSMWNIEGGGTFYLIEKDGEALVSNSALPGNEMDIPGMADGTKLNIYVKNPNQSGNEKATITVDYGDYGEAAVKYMMVDDEDITVVDGKFEAPQDGMLLVFTDNLIYNILSVKLGDEELQYIVASGCYVGFINGDATLTITAEPRPDADITLSLTSAGAVNVFKAYNSYFIGNDKVEGLKDGDNKLTISPAMPVLDIQVDDAYSVVSATYTDADGKTADMPYDSWGKYYYVDVIAKNVVSINIETTEKVIEYITFGVEIENVDVLKSYFIRTNNPRKFIADSDDPALLLKNGLNEFTVTTEQAASIRLNLEFVGDPITDVTIDGEPVPTMKYEENDNSVWGDFTIGNGQVLKIGKTSAINSLTNDSAARKVYNMQGMEVKGDNLPSGIYIINGKKTYVR